MPWHEVHDLLGKKTWSFWHEDMKTCFLTWRHEEHDFRMLDKPRRLWRLAVATHPRTQYNLPVICNFVPLPEPNHKLRVPRSGTDISPMMFRTVGPASQNPDGVRLSYPTAALLRSLQWVSYRYVSLQDTALPIFLDMKTCRYDFSDWWRSQLINTN